MFLKDVDAGSGLPTTSVFRESRVRPGSRRIVPLPGSLGEHLQGLLEKPEE